MFLRELVAIFIGGGLGATCRWLSSRLFFHLPITATQPWVPVMLINVIGSLVMGVCYALLVKHLAVNALWRGLIMVGFLGGLTTFSSFSLDVMSSMEFGNLVGVIANIVLSVVLSISACALGIWLVKMGLQS